LYTPKYGEEWTLSQIMPAGGYIALCVIAALCLVAAVAFLVFFFRKKGERKLGVRYGKALFFTASVGLALSGIIWIVTLVTGFLPQ
ncbi:MAG: hypothetical protein K2H43_04975, partial [Clostridia bacterium]|nr:hypothetical protein [Clostridia bacterium]